MPNEYKMTPHGRVELTDDEQAALDAVRAQMAEEQALADAKEATRLSKRPKRSKINQLKQQINNATTIADLKTAMIALTNTMDDVLAYQSVNVDEQG